VRLVAVGTGTVVPEADRGGSSFYVEAPGSRVLLDCGPGAVQSLARFGLPWQAITDLIITHFHADHVGALPGLLFALKHGIMPPRSEPLSVWGPPGTRLLFSRLAAALGEFVLDPGFPLGVRELASGGEATTSGGIEIAVRHTPHTLESHAVRLQASGVTVAYTGDTGLPEGEAGPLGAFLRGADVLIAECSLTEDTVGDNHLSPRRLAKLATEANPDLLWVTHVYPHVRGCEDIPSLVAAAGCTGRVHLVADGDTWSQGA
jgi:ribonuclease BN (tRNA processing enzyme)